MERTASLRDAGLLPDVPMRPPLIVLDVASYVEHAPSRARERIPAIVSSAGRAAALLCEVAGLWAINRAGYFIVERLRLPLPGNVAGMLLLFALLCSGIVPERLFARSSALLTRHLAFFFVPIAVGLMDLASVFVAYGIPIAIVLVASAAIGLCSAGAVAQGLLLRAPKERP
jgi:holin-like protein